MPQSVTICYEGPRDLELLARALDGKGDGVLTRYPEQLEYAVEGSPPVVIDVQGDHDLAAMEYFENEAADPLLRLMAPDLCYASVYFRDMKTARWVLRLLLEQLISFGHCWVDSDCGWTMPGSWFLEQLRGSETWDWRTRAPEERNRIRDL